MSRPYSPRTPKGECACGNRATIWRRFEWVCERCQRLESMSHEFTRETSGRPGNAMPYRVFGISI